jgi:outer membrane protein TolC
MKKILILLIATSLGLFGMSYEQFKQSVLRNSKILQSKRLDLSAAEQENAILLRAENPLLEVEMSQFNPEFGDTRPGYRATYSQPIRTGGFYDALSQKATANKLLREAYVSHGVSGFLKELEKLYTEYVYRERLVALLQRDLTVSQRVAGIAEERFRSGAESRAQFIQAKTEAMMTRTKILDAKRQARTLYYQLLGLAGLSKKVVLRKAFIYPLSAKVSGANAESPLSRILAAKKESFAAEAAANDRTLKAFSLYGEMEKEPDQSIARIGISVPIPFFNQNREEKALAMIKMRQAELDRQQLHASETMRRVSLQSAIRDLSLEYQSLKTLQKEQQELLSLFEEGYRISKGSLLDLMLTKRRLIETGRALLQTQKLANDQRIELNYLQGKYHD